MDTENKGANVSVSDHARRRSGVRARGIAGSILTAILLRFVRIFVASSSAIGPRCPGEELIARRASTRDTNSPASRASSPA